jgi:hypothetical protein
MTARAGRPYRQRLANRPSLSGRIDDLSLIQLLANYLRLRLSERMTTPNRHLQTVGTY